MKLTCRSVLVAFALCLAAVSVAQAYDYGVSEDRDEFTGEYTCSHRVDNSLTDDSGIKLVRSEEDDLGVVVLVYRDWSTDPQTWVFSSVDNVPVRGDMVYFRFPDGEVISLVPDYVDVAMDAQETDIAGWWEAEPLAARIMSLPGDLRVRFEGTHGQRDFTISHDVVRTLADGFGSRCMP